MRRCSSPNAGVGRVLSVRAPTIMAARSIVRDANTCSLSVVWEPHWEPHWELNDRGAALWRVRGQGNPSRSCIDVLRQTETMRKQYHFWPGEGGMDAWDVDHLIERVAHLPVEEVALDDLPEIDSEYWFDERERPTVRKVIEHFRLVGEVDPSYAIILGPGNRVMDGMHRVARALLDGRRTIKARRLRELPEPDYRGCRPDELPY